MFVWTGDIRPRGPSTPDSEDALMYTETPSRRGVKYLRGTQTTGGARPGRRTGFINTGPEVAFVFAACDKLLITAP